MIYPADDFRINNNNSLPPASHGGNRWAAQEKWGIAAESFLDFSASINPLGPPPMSLQAIQDNLPALEYYPEPGGAELKKALAEYLQIGEQGIVLGNGSTELIYLCTRLFCRRRVVVLAPSFSEYGQGVDNPRLVKVDIDLKSLKLPITEIAAVLKEGDVLFIANPNNPTGNLFARWELLLVLELVKDRQATLVVDEAFIDFAGDKSASLRDVCSQVPNLVVLGSLTKFFALPGLRIGYALSNDAHNRKMERLLPPWRINSLALAAGSAALKDQDYIQSTLRLIARERDFLDYSLNQIPGLSVYPAQANFILIDAKDLGITAGQLQDLLGPQGILIRDCSNFDNLSPYHLRVAVRSHPENEILVAALKEALIRK